MDNMTIHLPTNLSEKQICVDVFIEMQRNKDCFFMISIDNLSAQLLSCNEITLTANENHIFKRRMREYKIFQILE